MVNDKAHRHHLKGGDKMFKAYRSIAMDILKMVHDDHLLFHVRIESSSNTWYDVSLSTPYCNFRIEYIRANMSLVYKKILRNNLRYKKTRI